VSGKVALVISSFSKKGGQDAQQWARQFSMEFAQDSNVICYSVIFLESVPRLFRGFVTSGIKKGMPEEKHSQAIRVLKMKSFGRNGWEFRMMMLRI
jgi:hypothetical protein